MAETTDVKDLSGQFRRLNTVSFGGLMRLKNEDIPYQELWAEVHWTEDAAKYIRDEEYAYISPEFDLAYTDSKSGDVVGAALLAIGLTNRPFLKGMARVTVNDDNTSDIQVMATGEWFHQFYGRITIEPRHLTEMISNMPAVFNTMKDAAGNGPTEMMVDYNHQSLFGGPDEARAAGWVRGKGVYVKKVEEEEKKQKKAASDVHAVQQRIAASDGMSRQVSSTTPKESGLKMKDERVRSILKLAENVPVTDEHRTQAFELLDQQVSGGVVLSADEVTTLKAQAAQGATALAEMQDQMAHAAVSAALSAHKILPAQVAWATKYTKEDPTGFKAFIDGQPVIVPSGRDGDNGVGTAGQDPTRHEVQLFIDTKVAENVAPEAAIRLARKQFGEAAFKAWRFPNRKAA